MLQQPASSWNSKQNRWENSTLHGSLWEYQLQTWAASGAIQLENRIRYCEALLLLEQEKRQKDGSGSAAKILEFLKGQGNEGGCLLYC